MSSSTVAQIINLGNCGHQKSITSRPSLKTLKKSALRGLACQVKLKNMENKKKNRNHPKDSPILYNTRHCLTLKQKILLQKVNIKFISIISIYVLCTYAHLSRHIFILADCVSGSLQRKKKVIKPNKQ